MAVKASGTSRKDVGTLFSWRFEGLKTSMKDVGTLFSWRFEGFVIASAHACMHGHTSAIKSHKADHIHARRDMSVGVRSMSARDLAEGDHIVDKKGPLRLAHERAS